MVCLAVNYLTGDIGLRGPVGQIGAPGIQGNQGNILVCSYIATI